MRRRSSRSNRHGTPRMRLPISVPAPGIFSTASENFLGMKWVYASMRIDHAPDQVRPHSGRDFVMGGEMAGRGHAERANVKASLLRRVFTRALRERQRSINVTNPTDLAEALCEALALWVREG